MTWSWGLALTTVLLMAISMMLLELVHTRINNEEARLRGLQTALK